MTDDCLSLDTTILCWHRTEIKMIFHNILKRIIQKNNYCWLYVEIVTGFDRFY